MKQQLKERFISLFGADGDIRYYFAPGRVNLIGEHTDYNGGHVFPCALTIGTYAAVRLRDDRKLRFFSENFKEIGIIEGSLDALKWTKEAQWTNYPQGVAWAFIQKGYPVDRGFDMYLTGNIPDGSGLSSSASVEIVTGVALRDLLGYTEKLTMVDLALIGQYSENKYNGMNCGIMDQFAVAMGKKDCAIYLDTSDLSYTYAPVKLEGKKLVIISSNKKRRLEDSKYNERRSQCEAALADLQKELKISALGDLTCEKFDKNAHLIMDETNRRRAKHAVYENQRTLKAVAALKAGDIDEFGRLMNESHVSLRDDYEVTGKELDTLAALAWKQPGVIGSRMTGAGFGGCTVSIVNEDSIDAFIKNVGSAYEKEIGYAADFIIVDIGDGGMVL